jgi:hypothetical protein
LGSIETPPSVAVRIDFLGRVVSSHVPVAVFALAPTDVTVDSLKVSALSAGRGVFEQFEPFAADRICHEHVANLGSIETPPSVAVRIDFLGRVVSSHVPVAVFALAPTDVTVDSLKVSALFHLLAPPLHMVCLGVMFP